MREHIIFHIDVNSAFLSWSSVENLRTGTGPDLRLIPSVIGGDERSRHGIVLAKSIPAKAFGISTAEPIASARKKCPGLVVAPSDHQLYREYSHRLMDHLRTYSTILEQLSVDECFLDVTALVNDPKDAASLGRKIADSVRDTFGFTVNVGISTRKVLAKMASDFQKPDKVHTLFPWEIEEKMWPLPIGDLYMAGRSSATVFKTLGMPTIGDVAKADVSIIETHLKSHGRMLWEFANGIDSRMVETEREEAKGVGNSTTLSHDVTDRAEALRIIDHLCEKVSQRLKKEKKAASTVTLEIKYSDFTSYSKQTGLLSPSSKKEDLFATSVILFDQLWNEEAFRLLGVRATKLQNEEEPVQMNLFDLDYSTYHKSEKQKKLDAALGLIRSKYGNDAVKTGDEIK